MHSSLHWLGMFIKCMTRKIGLLFCKPRAAHHSPSGSNLKYIWNVSTYLLLEIFIHLFSISEKLKGHSSYYPNGIVTVKNGDSKAGSLETFLGRVHNLGFSERPRVPGKCQEWRVLTARNYAIPGWGLASLGQLKQRADGPKSASVSGPGRSYLPGVVVCS